MGQLKSERVPNEMGQLANQTKIPDTTKKQAPKVLPKEVLDFNKKQAKKNKPVVTGKTGN
jgi:hypothetical protein